MNYTDELNLNKTDMETDGEQYFDFDRDLNENWEKIDKFAKEQRLNGLFYEKIKDIKINIPVQAVEDVDVAYYETKELD